MYVMERYGMKTCLSVAAIGNTIAVIIKYAASQAVVSGNMGHHDGFQLLLFGQFVAACAQPFFLNVSPSVFRELERSLYPLRSAAANIPCMKCTETPRRPNISLKILLPIVTSPFSVAPSGPAAPCGGLVPGPRARLRDHAHDASQRVGTGAYLRIRGRVS